MIKPGLPFEPKVKPEIRSYMQEPNRRVSDGRMLFEIEHHHARAVTSMADWAAIILTPHTTNDLPGLEHGSAPAMIAKAAKAVAAKDATLRCAPESHAPQTEAN